MTDQLSLREYNHWNSLFSLFRELHPRIELQMIQLFLLVAHRPGKTQKEYGELVGLSQSSVSRNFSALSNLTEDGFGLLSLKDNPLDRRLMLVTLTAKGHELLRKIKAIGTP